MRLAISIILFFLALPAAAHIRMISPLPRLDVDNLKQNARQTNPCGNQPRGNNPYIYAPNQVVPIVLQETINHPGRFIVQFSLFNDLGFELPENELARLEDTMSGGMRTLQARMPNAECDRCTLRVVQVMDDQPGELYVHCIDINLRASTNPPGGQSTLGSNSQPLGEKPGFGCGRVQDNDAGPMSGSNRAAGLILLLLLPMLAYWRLRNQAQRRLSIRI